MSISGNEKKALKALQTELSTAFRVRDLRLFGSKVRGKDTPGSDLDVLIVLEDSSAAVEERIDGLIFDLNLKFDCFITPLYFSSAEIESGPLSESPVYKKALAEGISF